MHERPLAVIEVDSLSLSYGETVALKDINLRIQPGEAVAVLGASGSGKSSLLLCMAGIERPDSGTVSHESRVLSRESADSRASWRLRYAGFVFQAATLVPELSLRDNVRLPLELLRVATRRALRQSDELIERLGLAQCADRRPGQVSGGQAQRAAIARALVHKPAVVFADEPTGALDTSNRAIVLDLLQEGVRHVGATLLMITHDVQATWPGMRRITLRDGSLAHDSRMDG